MGMKLYFMVAIMTIKITKRTFDKYKHIIAACGGRNFEQKEDSDEILESHRYLRVYDYGLCCLSFGNHLLIGVDYVGYLLGVFADVIGKGSTLKD